MRNVYQQKNKLKDLIYIQENKPCNEQTIKGLFRSIVEPILDNSTESPSESLVLIRLQEKSKKEFNSVLKRLEFSNASVYDFSDDAEKNKTETRFNSALKEKIWDKTEFVYVLTERFGAVLIFDYEENSLDGFADFYLLHNSKKLSEAFEIINANSTVDLSDYQEKTHPDRRDNDKLNLSIRKIVEILNETNQDVLIAEIEKEKIEDNKEMESIETLTERLDFITKKSSFVSHEMRNLLSICNLYSDIIEKQTSSVVFMDKDAEKSVNNARNCIRKSLQMIGNILIDFKSMNSINLKEYDLKKLIEDGLTLAKIYASSKDITFECDIPTTTNVLVDENKFLSVLVNLIKNAVESIEEKGDIVVSTKIENENVSVTISNSGNPISEELQKRIFEEGFTTKASGSGLGLVICRKTLEEQYAKLNLKKSDEQSTEFEITLLKA